MYRWRQLTAEDRTEVLRLRQQRHRPLHSPHHVDSGERSYLITAACFEHVAHIGHSLERMNQFAEAWLDVLHQHSIRVAAWALLPNHYHALLSTREVLKLLASLGRLHGRTSFYWNGEEQTRGRKVWCNAVETVMKSNDHYFGTLNYVHHNPVKHGYAARWTDWPWSSASDFLAAAGHDEAARLWKTYPINDYGNGWDDAEL